MFDSIYPAEGKPIGEVNSRWLWVAQRSTLICTIALGLGFVAASASEGSTVALTMFGLWGLVSLALLYLLFRRGKNSLAFALGLGAAPAFVVLLAVAAFGLSRLSGDLRHLLFIILMFGGGLPPFFDMTAPSSPYATLGALLLGLFIISSAVLVISSIVAFQEMAHEAKETGKLRLVFAAGICCAPLVWLMFMLLRLSLGDGFGM